MATQFDPQLNSLQEQSSTLKQKLVDSPTALGGESAPTSSDLNTQVRYDALQKQILGIKKKAATEKWYGPQTSKASSDTPQEGVKPSGFITSALDVISRPARLVEGGIAHALGKGTGTDVFDSMNRNMNVDKRTFGDLLKSENVPYWISAPLGFMLDVTFDPVNWATAGTAALVPRLGAGLWKGAAEEGITGAARGLGLAAKSGVLNKAAFAEKYIPTFGAKNTEVYKNALERMQGAAVSSTEKYNTLIGKDIKSMVGGYGAPALKIGETAIPTFSPIGSTYRASLGDLIETAASKNTFTEKLFNSLNYSNKDWMRTARIKDSLQNHLGIASADMEQAAKAHLEGKPIDQYLAQTKATIEKTPASEASIGWEDTQISPQESAAIDKAVASLSATGSKLSDPTVAQNLAKIMEDGTDIANDSRNMSVTLDPIENGDRMTSMAEAMAAASKDVGSQVTLEDIAKLANSGALNETGIKWYDNMIGGINRLKKTVKTKDGQEKTYYWGKSILDGLQFHTAIFKVMKVAASPGSWMNSVVGNGVMLQMMGVNSFDKGFLEHLNNARKLAMGSKDSDLLVQRFYENPEVMRIMRDLPTAFSRTTGLQPNLAAEKLMASHVLKLMNDAGLPTAGIATEEFGRGLAQAIEEEVTPLFTSSDMLRADKNVSKTAAGISKEGIGSSVKMAAEQIKKGLSASERPTSYSANEILDSTLANKFFETIKAKAAAPDASIYVKGANLLFNKSINGYDHIDQSYKIATIMYATKNGLTEGELTKVARFVQMSPEEVTKVVDGGVIRYRISGEKALEVANEAFLNYNAMPAAIKMLRSAPLVGSPFASFMYGMLLKTANTAAYNTSVFNKMSFAMNDFGGTTTPLEKKGLKGQYYSYLDTPSMFKLPFAKDNPTYVNMANVIPYYSFNMFNPSERKYTDLYPDNLVNIIDNTPFLKDPVGALIFDYMIQPLILSNSVPVGAFNQPLYPHNANFGTKALYAGRNLLESVVPGVVAPLGAAVPSAAAEFLPSYGMRKFSNAGDAQNPQGIPGSESGLSRYGRAFAGYAGVPVQAPMDLTFTAKAAKKNNQ